MQGLFYSLTMSKAKHPYKNLSLADMPGEKWKDIPEYIDYYQVSNYGRIKALERWVERPVKGDIHLKERILKQTIKLSLNPFTKEYYKRLSVSICRNAKKKGITTGRLVYYLFVKKFDQQTPVVVTPKNGDNLDTHFKNLRLVKKGDVQTKTYQDKKKRRPVKKLSQYDTDGRLLKTYHSIIEAAAKTGIGHNTLSQAANGHLLHCGGWLWKFGERKKIKAVKFPYRHVRRVAQYTPDGKLVRSYFSITEAEKITGFDDIGIRDAALKKRPFYKTFIWKFVD